MKAYLKKIFAIIGSFFCTISIVSALKFTTQDGITYMHIKNILNPIKGISDLIVTSTPEKTDINYINSVILDDNPFKYYRVLGIGDLFNNKVNFKINGITYMPIQNLINPSTEYFHVVIINIENNEIKKIIQEAFKTKVPKPKGVIPPIFMYNKYKYQVIEIDTDILDEEQQKLK